MPNIICQTPIAETIKFLGLTVLSFNGTLGWGTQESSLSVDLIEDCGDAFTHADLIGFPVYFNAGAGFAFNGVLTNWTVQQGRGGKTYNVRISDPRHLLENTVVVVDSYAGPPLKHTNYFNAYAFYESSVYTNNNCAAFGTATAINGVKNSIERGMPYVNIIGALQAMAPALCSSTGAIYNVNLGNLAALNIPGYFRASGPTMSMLQIVQDICDANGADFYVNLEAGNTITVYPIILQPAANLDAWIAAYNGTASDLSYGRELTSNKTKTIIFGGSQHYLTYSNSFNYYFGEDSNGNPRIPKGQGDCGFIVDIDLKPLNVTLYKPLNINTGAITEIELRAALSSEALWKTVVFNGGGDSFAGAIRATFPDAVDAIANVVNRVLPANLAGGRPIVDMINDIRKPVIDGEKFELSNEIKKIHQFVVNLAQSFYGKKFLVPIPDKICKIDDPEQFKEKIYSAQPTNDGGWVEPNLIGGAHTLLLGNPEIQLMMQDDGRIGAFATFARGQNSGVIPSGDSSVPDSSDIGEDYVPGGP